MKTNRCKIFLALLHFGFNLSASADQQVLSQPIQKVILISVDTLRADYLGCYNPKMKTSPALDEFASRNIICRNVTSQSATTAPSHKSIFYSVYPSIHKTSIRTVPQEKEKSPMEIIRAQGFTTAAFTGGAQLSHSFGFARGFDTYWEPREDPGIKHRIGETQKLVFDWLENHYNDKFFLFLHTFEVHCPYDPPTWFFQKWAGWYKGLIRKDKCFPDYFLSRRTSTEDYDYIQSLYSAEVNYVDNFLGHLFQKLKTLGIHDQILIIFLSDHGESLGEHGYIGHSQPYQVQLYVPLILHIPGIASTRLDAPLELLDVMPTIFELLGIESEPGLFQGKSLMPLIRDQRAFDKSRPLISEERGRVRVRIRDLALIFSLDGKTHEELYNLKIDPHELQNIAKVNRKLVEQLKAVYFQMLTTSKDLSARFILEAGKKPNWSEETAEQLKALGYVGH